MKDIIGNYNERSWAIDLIGFLKQHANVCNRSIRDVGGEQSIKVEGGHLFPDVLLFGDRSAARILQGWELKMPDTNIDDYEFRKNAEMKADALGLDSYILWNVSIVHLYVRSSETNKFELRASWDNLSDLKNRKEVLGARLRWESLALEIFNYLNDLFDRGVLEGRQFIEAYKSGGVTSLILENADSVEDALIRKSHTDVSFRSEMIIWWEKYRSEYQGSSMGKVLGKAILSNWIGKILFAQILRERDQRAMLVATVNEDMTPKQALAIFAKLSEVCNFWTIFSDDFLGLELIPKKTWSHLLQFNNLLNDLRLGAVDQGQLSNILEATVQVNVRKLRGQYPTPITLARLLVQLSMKNTIDDRVLDPCCGSGTIPRAVIEQKLLAGVDADKVSSNVFAGDQDPQAVQIATFALAKPDLMHRPLKLFQRDAFRLSSESVIDFRNPSNGKVFSEKLGYFQTIVSNLPFVSQEGRKRYLDSIGYVRNQLGINTDKFTKRADIAAYLPFVFHSLLDDNGRLGIIITNAWLGTAWGDEFYNRLIKLYNLKSVITSGVGRWFQNSEVVTNMLIFEKRDENQRDNCQVDFVILKVPLEDLTDNETFQLLAAQIESGRVMDDSMTLRSVSLGALEKFAKYGLRGNAQFVKSDWILELPLVSVKKLFKVRRGERRGNNKLFYPSKNHGIEKEYIRTLVKDLKSFTRLVGSGTKEAFCCSETEDRLRELGHFGALNWIERFKTAENIKKLTRKGLYWYQMDGDRVSQLAMTINYGKRLFIPKIEPAAFVDQRLVVFDPKGDVDIELCHALLNSAISLFIIEGMGFGRGLGALDLNKDRIEDFMHLLDPTQLTSDAIKKIKREFSILKKRNVMEIADELEQQDRKNFDDAIIEGYKLPVDRREIYDSLLALVEVRMAAIQ